MLPYIILAALLFPDVAGLAGVYGYPGDTFDRPGPTACEAPLVASLGKARFQRMLSSGVAHRTLPCGTALHLVRGGRSATAYVVDRGPFGIVQPGRRWRAGKRLRTGEIWRGVLDLRPGVAKELGFSDGLFFVAGWVVKNNWIN